MRPRPSVTPSIGPDPVLAGTAVRAPVPVAVARPPLDGRPVAGHVATSRADRPSGLFRRAKVASVAGPVADAAAGEAGGLVVAAGVEVRSPGLAGLVPVGNGVDVVAALLLPRLVSTVTVPTKRPLPAPTAREDIASAMGAVVPDVALDVAPVAALTVREMVPAAVDTGGEGDTPLETGARAPVPRRTQAAGLRATVAPSRVAIRRPPGLLDVVAGRRRPPLAEDYLQDQ